MTQIFRHPDFKLFFGVFVLVVIGAEIGSIFGVGIYFLLYGLIVVLQMLSYGFGIVNRAVFQGSGAAAVRGFFGVSKIAIPLYVVVFILFSLDLQRGWHLVMNPISVVLFYFSLNFLVSRTNNRAQANGLLRGANPTSQDGVASQRRPVAPDFSAAQPSPVQPTQEAAPKPGKPNKPRKQPSGPADPFASAVRPPDEDE